MKGYLRSDGRKGIRNVVTIEPIQGRFMCADMLDKPDHWLR